MSDVRASSSCTPAAKQRRPARSSERTEWQLLQPELLCQALSDDSDAALRRAARAVCRDWRAVVDARLITQLCCDIDQLHRIGKLLGLRHVVVEGAASKMRGRRHMQQRLWAQARLSSSSASRGVSQELPEVDILPAPRADLSPLAALPGVQAVTLRCLTLLTRNFQQQAAYLTHLTSLTLHHPFGICGLQMEGVPEALSALTQLKALTLIQLPRPLVRAALSGRVPAPAALGGADTAEHSSNVPSASQVPIPRLAGLQSLTIRHTGLPPLEDVLASLTSCTHLDLSHCSFTYRVPPRLGQLTQLKVLDLGYSRSERVPKSCWSCLTALTRLCLSGAGLQGYRHVPLKELPSLVHLELRDQKLGPKALLGCTGLQVLDLRGSQLSSAAAAEDTFGEALRQQPALKTVLYHPFTDPMLKVLGQRPGVDWVPDPAWGRTSRFQVGDMWKQYEEDDGSDRSSWLSSSEDSYSDSGEVDSDAVSLSSPEDASADSEESDDGSDSDDSEEDASSSEEMEEESDTDSQDSV